MSNDTKIERKKKKRKDQRTMTENLNIKVDRIIGKNASIPKSIHIRNIPISVYINKTYIPNNISKEIRTHSETHERARFLKTKHRWTQQILDDIE